MSYNLVILGNGATAIEAAVAAARINQSAVIVANPAAESGHPSHSAADVLAAMQQMVGAVGQSTSRHGTTTRRLMFDDVSRRAQAQLGQQDALRESLLSRWKVDIVKGDPAFVGPHEVSVLNHAESRTLTAEKFLLACETQSARPSHIPFDGRHVISPHELLQLEGTPRSVLIAGAGTEGLAVATLLAECGVQVTLIDRSRRLLPGFDADLVDGVLERAARLGVLLHLGEEVIGVERKGRQCLAVLDSGTRMRGDVVVYAAGRRGHLDGLNLKVLGLVPDERGRLWCDALHCTGAAHVFAAGDVVGFPCSGRAVGAGRTAVWRAFGRPVPRHDHAAFRLATPRPLWRIGTTEEQLEKVARPHAVALAQGSDVGFEPRPENGPLFKVLFTPHTQRLLGIHALAEIDDVALQVIQSLLATEGTLPDLCAALDSVPGQKRLACLARAAARIARSGCREEVPGPHAAFRHSAAVSLANASG